MRIAHYYAALGAWYESERERQRWTAELVRMQTTDLLNIQLKKTDRIKPGKLWTFPWDDDEQDDPMTDEKIREMHLEIMKKFK